MRQEPQIEEGRVCSACKLWRPHTQVYRLDAGMMVTLCRECAERWKQMFQEHERLSRLAEEPAESPPPSNPE